MMSCGLDHSAAMKFSTSINTKLYKLATLLFLNCPFSPLDKIRLCFLPVCPSPLPRNRRGIEMIAGGF